MHRCSSARKVEWHLCIFSYHPCIYALELFASALLLDEQEAQAFRTERRFVATCKRCCGNDKIANRSEVKEREISLVAEKT